MRFREPASRGSWAAFTSRCFDRRTLRCIWTLYETNGSEAAASQIELTRALDGLHSEDHLLVLSAVGTPVPAVASAVKGPTLAHGLRPFGATPDVVADLARHPRYALLGAISPVAAYGRGRRGMWYGPVAQNAPVSARSTDTSSRPPTRTNLETYRILGRVSAAWPVPRRGRITMSNLRPTGTEPLCLRLRRSTHPLRRRREHDLDVQERVARTPFTPDQASTRPVPGRPEAPSARDLLAGHLSRLPQRTAAWTSLREPP